MTRATNGAILGLVQLYGRIVSAIQLAAESDKLDCVVLALSPAAAHKRFGGGWTTRMTSGCLTGQVADPAHRRRRGLRAAVRRCLPAGSRRRGPTCRPSSTQDLVALLPVRRDDRHRGQRPLRQGATHAAIVNSNAATVWNDGRGLTLPGGNGGTAPAVRLPDSLLAGLTTSRSPSTCGSRARRSRGQVFAFGRTADNARLPRPRRRAPGRRRHSGLDRRSGREPRRPRPRPARRRCAGEHVQARGGDDQGRRRADARPAAAVRGRRAGGVQHRADPQALATSPRRSASSAARATRAGSSSGAGSRTSGSTPKELTAEPGAGAVGRRRRRATWPS